MSRWFVGDKDRPWWVEQLYQQGLITKFGTTTITDFIIFKRSDTDMSNNYLYEGDFLQIDDKTGVVTVGYNWLSRAISIADKPKGQDE